jgi:hypothetical protein
MHRQQLAHVIAIERDEIGDLLTLGLGELELLASLDLEADVPGRSEGDRLTRMKNGGCAAHDEGPSWFRMECTTKPVESLRGGSLRQALLPRRGRLFRQRLAPRFRQERSRR